MNNLQSKGNFIHGNLLLLNKMKTREVLECLGKNCYFLTDYLLIKIRKFSEEQHILS